MLLLGRGLRLQLQARRLRFRLYLRTFAERVCLDRGLLPESVLLGDELLADRIGDFRCVVDGLQRDRRDLDVLAPGPPANFALDLAREENR